MIRWLASPLTGTAGVLVCLCLVSIPLRRLTSAAPVVMQPATVVPAAGEIPAVLRLKLLAPAKRLSLQNGSGKILLDLRDLTAGEFEHDVALGFADDEIDILLHADFSGHQSETAVFLTVIPDGHEELTRYATGNGMLEETLRYEWHHAH
jgi:hypothetical protein